MNEVCPKSMTEHIYPVQNSEDTDYQCLVTVSFSPIQSSNKYLIFEIYLYNCAALFVLYIKELI